MAAILHPIYTLAHFGLAIWGLYLFQQSINIGTILLLVVILTSSLNMKPILWVEGNHAFKINLCPFPFNLFPISTGMAS